MPAVLITPADLAPFATIDSAKAGAMIADVMASAVRVAPCLRDETLTDDLAAAAKAILRGALLRWNDQGSGATTTVTTGAFSATTQAAERRGLLWPSEVTDLQDVCRQHSPDNGERVARAYAIDTAPVAASMHLPWCDLMFLGASCSCGASIAGAPIYEGGDSAW